MTDNEDMTPATSEESLSVPDPSGGRAKRHAAYNIMVKRAITGLHAKNGSSRKAIIRYICAHNNVKKSHCLKAVGRAIKRMVGSGQLYRNKRGVYKLTAKGRGLKAKKRRRRRRKGKKGGRKRRRGGRRKKGKKSKKGKKKKGKKSKKGKKKKSKKSRKNRRVRRRKSPKRANRRRKSAKRGKRKSKKSKKRRGRGKR